MQAVDELHRHRAGRQRHPQGVRQAQNDIEILVIEPALDAGREVAPRHPVAEEVEHAARRHPVQHRLAHLPDVQTRPARQAQRFRHALRRDQEQQLVARLRRLPCAVAAHVTHLRADGVKRGADPLQHRRIAPHHDRQRRIARAMRAAGNGRVEHLYSPLGQCGGDRPGGRRIDRAGVDDDQARLRPANHAVVAEQHLLDVGGGGQHREDDIAPARQRGG